MRENVTLRIGSDRENEVRLWRFVNFSERKRGVYLDGKYA